jgi:uncharacterized membrane protein YjjP (DUF1212 family)
VLFRSEKRRIRQKQATMLLSISKAFAEAGTPSHRLEAYMQVILEKFNFSGQFVAFPTAIIASIGEEGAQRTYMVKTSVGEISLGTLQRLNSVINDLENNVINIDTAIETIRHIKDHESEFPGWLFVLAYAIVGAGFSTLFAGSWLDVMAAFCLGAVTGTVAQTGEKYFHLSHVVVPFAAMLVGFLAILIHHYTSGINYVLVAVSGLIVLIPGLGITIAMRELSTDHLVSGSGRLAGAVTVLFLLSFGLALGYLIGHKFFGDDPFTLSPPTPDWFRYLAIVITSLAFSVIFKARLADVFWIFLSIVLAYTGSQVFKLWLDQPFISLATAVLIATAGNLYSRITDNPASLMQIPGIILLVPGSMGFNSLTAMYTQDTITGIQAAFSAALVAVAISVGLLAGNLFIPPKKDL